MTKKGWGIADISLDPGRKTSAAQVCTGRGHCRTCSGVDQTGTSAVAGEYERARKSYDNKLCPQGEGAFSLRAGSPSLPNNAVTRQER